MQIPKKGTFFKDIISQNSKVSIEDAVFRNEKFFKAGHLRNHVEFWEAEILKDHPNKSQLLDWIKGVHLK